MNRFDCEFDSDRNDGGSQAPGFQRNPVLALAPRQAEQEDLTPESGYSAPTLALEYPCTATREKALSDVNRPVNCSPL
jgi:hypothetical protein